MAADGDCEGGVVHGMNEWYGSWGTLKGVLNNRGFDDKYEEVST